MGLPGLMATPLDTVVRGHPLADHRYGTPVPHGHGGLHRRAALGELDRKDVDRQD